MSCQSSVAVGVVLIDVKTDLPPRKHREVVSKTQVSDWVEMSVPALSGPHSSRPWAHSLRNLVQPPHRLNCYRFENCRHLVTRGLQGIVIATEEEGRFLRERFEFSQRQNCLELVPDPTGRLAAVS